MVKRKSFKKRVKYPKYEVVGSKKGSGRVLSRHRKLPNARASAKRYENKGYHGAVHHRVSLKGENKARYGKYGYEADTRRGDVF